MTIEEALRQLILNSTQVSDIVGERFYPGVAPQGSDAPYCTYLMFNTATATTKFSPSTADTDRLRIDCVAPTFGEAVGLANAIRKKIDKFSGTVDDFDIDEIWYIDKSDDFDEGTREDSRLYRRQIDFDVRYNPQQQYEE